MVPIIDHVDWARARMGPLARRCLRIAAHFLHMTGRFLRVTGRLLWLGTRRAAAATRHTLNVPVRETPPMTPEQIVEMESSLRELHQRAD